MVKIYLPRVTSTGETIDVQTQDAVPPVEEGHETILVVEDEGNLRRLARQFLEKQGYKVLEAADGAAAITISSSYAGPIHLLLTDVIMPGMNGRELAQRLTSLRPQTSVLFMSGYTENVIGHNGTLDANGIHASCRNRFHLPALKTKVLGGRRYPHRRQRRSPCRLKPQASLTRPQRQSCHRSAPSDSTLLCL